MFDSGASPHSSPHTSCPASYKRAATTFQYLILCKTSRRKHRYHVCVRISLCVHVASFDVSWYGQKSRLSVEEAPDPTFVAPGRYPEYFLANEDFLCAKSSRTMDYDMESKVRDNAGEQTIFVFMGTTANTQ